MNARRILFVCLGNICRSPTAEAVFRKIAEDEGHRFTLDSAGTGSWHTGESPDPRMVEAGARRGYRLAGSARQVRPQDFHDFDLILAMDRDNLRDLERQRPSEPTADLRLFRDFDPEEPGTDVPDPYYGGEDGFDRVVRIVERTSRNLLNHFTPRG